MPCPILMNGLALESTLEGAQGALVKKRIGTGCHWSVSFQWKSHKYKKMNNLPMPCPISMIPSAFEANLDSALLSFAIFKIRQKERLHQIYVKFFHKNRIHANAMSDLDHSTFARPMIMHSMRNACKENKSERFAIWSFHLQLLSHIEKMNNSSMPCPILSIQNAFEPTLDHGF